MAADTQPQSVSDLASLHLKAINAPDTVENRRVVAAWMALESGWVPGSNNTKINVTGNNPLNITGTGDCGSRSAWGLQFAVYCNPQSGAGATANLLTNNPQYGYTKIVAALQENNTPAALQAISASSWSGSSHYGNGVNLRNAFQFLAGNSLTPAGDLPSASGTTPFQDKLKAVGISTDPAHVITNAEAATIAGIYGVDPKLFASSLPGRTIGDLTNGQIKGFDLPGTVVGVAGGVAGAVVSIPDFLKTVSQPQTWLRVLAVGGGLLLILVGSKTMVDDLKQGITV